MAFLSQWIHSLEHTKMIVYNINWVSLSYILISGENNGKAVEDKVRHFMYPAHLFTHKESAPKNKQYENNARINDEK